MSVTKNVRLAVAASLVALMPLQGVVAATRPSAAIPSAATAVAAQDGDDYRGRGAGWALPAVGVILAAIILAIIIERHNGRGRGTGFSR